VIIQQNPNAHGPIQTNFARVFRGHNIMEYKSPDDYVSVRDF
jgi:hypothetical protein